MYFSSCFRTYNPGGFKAICDLIFNKPSNWSSRWDATVRPSPSHWGCTDVPKFLLDGTENKFGTLEYGEDLWNRIDGARINVLDGAGHYLIQEEPDATVQKMRKFINEKKA